MWPLLLHPCLCYLAPHPLHPRLHHLQRFTEDICLFQEKVLKRSGLGQDTYVPTCEAHTPDAPGC